MQAGISTVVFKGQWKNHPLSQQQASEEYGHWKQHREIAY